jgi:histidine triad (HIT) family protein
MSGSDCLFDKIVAGELPCWKLHEDEHTLAFLDIGPLSKGHALVIPKQCYATLDEVPDEIAAALGSTVRRVGAAVAKATKCPGWNVLQNNGAAAGQEVFHVHFHIIPRQDSDGLGYRWLPKNLAAEDAEALCHSIRAKL